MPEWPDQFDAIEEFPGLPEILNKLAKLFPKKVVLEGMLLEGEFLLAEIVDSIKSLQKQGIGDLRDSYQVGLVQRKEDSVSVGVFSELVYAEIQDTGDTIKPKTVKWLAYPHEDAKAFVGIRWARDFPKKGAGSLGFALSKHDPKGTAYLFGKEFAHPMFILKKKVTIPGMQYLDDALVRFNKEVERPIDSSVGLVFEEAGFK
jgi:hypothetical protein